MGYHRKNQRFDVHFGSTFVGEALAGQGMITNLSVGGCSIESNITLTAHSIVELKIHFPGSPCPLEVAQAVVRWVHGNSFGLEFQTLSGPETTRLQQYLQDLEQATIQTPHSFS